MARPDLDAIEARAAAAARAAVEHYVAGYVPCSLDLAADNRALVAYVRELETALRATARAVPCDEDGCSMPATQRLRASRGVWLACERHAAGCAGEALPDADVLVGYEGIERTAHRLEVRERWATKGFPGGRTHAWHDPSWEPFSPNEPDVAVTPGPVAVLVTDD